MSKVHQVELGQDKRQNDNKTMARADQSVFVSQQLLKNKKHWRGKKSFLQMCSTQKLL